MKSKKFWIKTSKDLKTMQTHIVHNMRKILLQIHSINGDLPKLLEK